MKKLVKKILILGMCGSVFFQNAAMVSAGEVENNLPVDEEVFLSHSVKAYTIGAATGGKMIDLTDCSEILMEALGINPVSEYQQFISDVNGDGNVTLKDAAEVLKIALGIDEINMCNSISADKGKISAFILEKENGFQDSMQIIESSEVLNEYLSDCPDETKQHILEKYKDIFEESNLLAVSERVYTDNLSAVESYTVINGYNIMEQTQLDEINVDEQVFELKKFCVIDKKFTNETAKLIFENSQVANYADIIPVAGNGPQTVDYTQATQNIHMLRNEEELKEYKDFLNKTYTNVNIDSLEKYTGKMNSSSFKEAAYVVFTYNYPSGSFEYKITELKVENGILNVELKYIDENQQGIPGEKDCLNCVFVRVPVNVLDNVSDVKLTVK